MIRLFLLLSLLPAAAYPAAAVFSGSDVKILKNNLDINGQVKLKTGTADPSAVATAGNPGSLYHNTSTGAVYRKTDSGSSTNWVLIGNPTLDNVTIEDSGGLRVKDAGISAAKLATDAVETAKIKDLNVTTGKLAANAVTRAKMESVGQQLSSSCGAFTTSSTSYVDVTNLTVTITTTGRPVACQLVSDGTNSTTVGDCKIGCTSDAATCATFLILYQDSTIVAQGDFADTGSASGAGSQTMCSAFNHVYAVAAGTYVFKVQAKASGAGTFLSNVTRAKLMCREL